MESCKIYIVNPKASESCFLNISNLGYFPLTQHHTVVSLVTKPSSLITWTYHKVETAVVYHIQKVSRKSSWKANGTWLFRSFQLKNFCEQQNFWKGNVFLFQMFQTEIRDSFHWSHLWYQLQAFVDFFLGKWIWFVQMVNEIQGRNLPVLNFAYHLPKPWIDIRLPLYFGKQSPRFVLSPSAESPLIDGKQHIYTMAQSVSGIVFLFIDHYPSQKYMTIKISER